MGPKQLAGTYSSAEGDVIMATPAKPARIDIGTMQSGSPRERILMHQAPFSRCDRGSVYEMAREVFRE